MFEWMDLDGRIIDILEVYRRIIEDYRSKSSVSQLFPTALAVHKRIIDV